MELKAGWTTRLLLAAPAIHLSLCYYYLFLRSFGFGSNLSEFVAAGDVFTVGLSKLILTYIIFLLGAVFGHLWVDADPLQVSGRTEVNLHPSLDRPGMRFVFNSIPYVTILGLAITLFDRKSVVLMLLPLIVIPFLARFAHAVSARNGYSYVIRTALIMFPIGIMNLTASAYGEGFRYRNRPPAYFASEARCSNGTIVLFASGAKYVGIEPSGQRILMSDECKKILEFPKSKVIIDAD